MISYDRLGFGSSAPLSSWAADYHHDGAEELLALLEYLGIDEPVALVGHSDGATIALLAAAAVPARVRAGRRPSSPYCPCLF